MSTKERIEQYTIHELRKQLERSEGIVLHQRKEIKILEGKIAEILNILGAVIPEQYSDE